MSKRIYFLMRDVPSTRDMADALLMAHVEDRRMHFIARNGTHLGALRTPGAAQRTDLIRGTCLGLAIGTLMGLLAGLWLYSSETLPTDEPPSRYVILIATAIGAVLGAWLASMIGTSLPNARHKPYAQAIRAGRILLVIDAPAGQVGAITALVKNRYPDTVTSASAPAIDAASG
jgi:hypothetical protein